MRTVLVLGLDSFGETIALTLAGKGVEVIAVDQDEASLQRVRDRVALVFVADVRDRAALKEICDREIDLAVVSLGGQVEPSVLATLLLKELEVPQILARARNDDHEKVLLKVGASRVVQPIRDSAERTALAVASKNLVEFVLAHAKDDPNAVFAGSVPYLMLGGNLVAGWQMARALLVAEKNIAEGLDTEFMRAKATTARFYADHILTRTTGLRDSIVDGAAAVTEMALEAY